MFLHRLYKNIIQTFEITTPFTPTLSSLFRTEVGLSHAELPARCQSLQRGRSFRALVEVEADRADVPAELAERLAEDGHEALRDRLGADLRSLGFPRRRENDRCTNV